MKSGKWNPSLYVPKVEGKINRKKDYFKNILYLITFLCPDSWCLTVQGRNIAKYLKPCFLRHQVALTPILQVLEVFSSTESWEEECKQRWVQPSQFPFLAPASFLQTCFFLLASLKIPESQNGGSLPFTFPAQVISLFFISLYYMFCSSFEHRPLRNLFGSEQLCNGFTECYCHWSRGTDGW